MEYEEFESLCKSAKPVSVEYRHYGDVKITFDNGIWVEIGSTVEYDQNLLVFESSTERYEFERERYKRLSSDKAARKAEKQHVQEVLSKLPPDQREEVWKILTKNR